MLRRLFGGPGFGGEPMHALVRLGGQAFEDVGEVRGGVDALAMTVADEGVERGGSCSALRVAHEQPVLLANGTGPDGVLDKVGVDLQATVAEEHAELWPLFERICERFAREAAWAVFVAGLQVFESGFDALHDGGAVLLSCAEHFFGSGAGLA